MLKKHFYAVDQFYSWATKGLAMASIPSTGQINTTAVPLEGREHQQIILGRIQIFEPADNQAQGACVISQPDRNSSKFTER